MFRLAQSSRGEKNTNERMKKKRKKRAFITSFNRVIIKVFFFLFLEETSSVKNAFLIGEINFEKKFNTFKNDTHERASELDKLGNREKKSRAEMKFN